MGARPRRRRDGRRATGARCQIRPARLADVSEIHAIEGAVFADPWSARDFQDCVAAAIPFFVAVEDGAVRGYVVARHAAGEGEILNLGVAPAHHRRGLGRALVRHTLAVLGAHGVRGVFLEVRDSNLAARRLYQEVGFKELGRRPRYYRRPAEDALILRAAIPAVEADA